ncbi:MAG: ACP S-malonyltransferase [Chloroflexi bacterium]|nr:ACP S-malonyltransferase [Chloroflexota bacterium]
MPRTAYLFPGQGSQRVGMGLDLFEVSPAARDVFAEADEAIKFSLSKLCFTGPAEALKQTVNAQPAVFVVSLACLAAAREALSGRLPGPDLVAGHSLGEYTALVAGGAISLGDGVKLVRERGRLMQEAGEKQRGSMAAVIGLDLETLQQLCRESGAEVANINSPGQIVVSGSKEDLEKAEQLAKSRGVRRFLPLEVSGAFHSRWMQPAYDGLKQAIGASNIQSLGVPLIANVSAARISAPDEVRSELSSQLSGCVRWQNGIENMLSMGISDFIEFGPGQVLTGLVRRTSKDARTRNVSAVADIKNWEA